jgi:transposase
MANKDLKKLLHMGAISAITHYPEFKDYYERKVTEGKHAQSVINAVRSKIALRAVAVINNQAKYVNNYKKAA